MKKFSTYLMLIMFFATLGLGVFALNQKQDTNVANALPTSSTYATRPSGSGTESQPYLIKTGDELAWVAQQVNSGSSINYVKLANNIELGTKIWTPIGTGSNSFTGNFDGDGYTIKNLLIDSTIETHDIGLFGTINGGTVQNLVMENAFILTSGYSNDSDKSIGVVAGKLQNSATIRNVAVIGGYVKYIGNNSQGTNKVAIGGIAGRVSTTTGTPKIENSFSSVNISNPGSDESYTKKSSLGGIVGYNVNSNLTLTNVYFTGKITYATSSSMDAITAGSSAGKKVNVYYAYTKATYSNGSITEKKYAGYWNVSQQSVVSNSEYTTELSSTIVNINIYNAFDNTSSSDRLRRVDENWIKEDGKYPVLRGVGNRVVAIKIANSYVDLDSNIMNSNKPVRLVQSLSDSSTMSLELHIGAAELTWDTYTRMRRLSGTNNNMDISTSDPNPNRLQSLPKTLSVVPTDQQGYYVFEITTTSLLHEYSFVVQDRYAWNATQNQHVATDKPGRLRFQNLGKSGGTGEVYYGVTTTNRGTKVDVNSWSAPIDFAVGSPVKVFVSKDTKVRVEAVIRTSASSSTVDTKYHSMNIFASNSNFSSRIDNQEKTFIASNENQNLQAGLIDLYKFTFDKDELFAKKNSSNQDTNNLYENVDRGEPERYYTNLASGLQDFGGRDVSEINFLPYIYLSYNTGRAFVENQNGTFSERTTNIFPVPEAAGYEFSGWFSQDKTVRFSHGKSNYFNNNQTSIRALMKTTNQTIGGGNYPVCQNTTLYGVWTVKEHTVQFASVLNLDESINWKSVPSLLLTTDEDELGNYLFNPEQTYWLQEGDIKIALQSGVSQTAIKSAVGHAGTITTLTDSGVKVSRDTEGYGYGLRAILIKNLNSDYSRGSFVYAPGTFEEDLENNEALTQSLYYDILDDQENSSNLHHVYSDIMVIAIFDIGTGRVNVNFNLNKPEEENTGFEFSYEIYNRYNRNDQKVGSGTVNENNLTIKGLGPNDTKGLSPLHYIVVTNMTVNGNKFKFSDNEDMRFQWDTSSYGIDLQTPSDHGEPGKWIFNTFVSMQTTFFNEKIDVQISINISYLGFSFALMQGYYDNQGKVQPLPTNASLPLPNFNLQNKEGPPAIINGNLADNVRPGSVFDIEVTNQIMWKVSPSWLVVVFEKGSTIPSGRQVEFEKQGDNYILYGFSGFAEDKEYDLYVIMEKVQYTIEISKQNSAHNQYIDVFFDGVPIAFNGNNAFVNVTFDQIFTMDFEINYFGYYIKDITVLNSKVQGLQEFAQQYALTKSLHNIDPTGQQIGSLTSIKVWVEPKQTYYEINYYKETTTDNQYALAETKRVENILVGTTVTINVEPNRYTGFSYFAHPNEVLTAVITYNAEEPVFKVYYQANTYTVIYNGNGHTGGSAPQNQQIKFGRTLTVATNSYTKTGHSFLHWNKSPNDLGTAKYTEGNQVVVNEEFIASANDNQVILYAIWQAKTIQIVFSSPDSGTVSSSQWTNRAGYTVYSNQTNAVALVTFGKQYGYIKNPADNTYIQKTDLIIPVRAGYIFKEWQKQDGTTVTAQTIVDVDQTITLYAVWEPKQVKVWYHSNLGSSGVSVKLSFDNKNLNTESKFGDFPTITWLSTQVFDLVGWSLDAAKSGSIVYLNADTPLPQGQDEIHVYAHWTPSTPELNDAPWSIILTYNGAKQRTLEVGTNGTYDKYITNAATSGSGIVYRYSWSKAGTPVAGENSSYLMLKNVADSGFYTVEVYAYHTIWGSSLIASATGEVIINRADLRVNVAKVGGKITKTYDHTTNITGVTTTNTGVLRATAKFKNANAATGITVIFTATFITDDPNNYNVYYEDGTENLNVDFKTTFDFYDTGDITPYNLTVSIGNRSGYANGLKHKVNASLISMSGQDSSFLGSAGHVLTGYVETADALAGVYTGTGLVNFLQVSNQDITKNYNITINGTYQIVESVLKTLVINKTALLNKDNSVAQSISPTEKFVLRYGVHDISQTNVYNIDGTYFNIVNDPNSNQIIISSDEDFSGSISIIPNAFTHTVGTTITQVVAYKWIAQGKDDVLTSSLEFSFALIAASQQKQLTVVYINHSTITYNARIVETTLSQTVYNTLDGIQTSHPAALDIASEASIDLTGLAFEGWYMGTSASAPQAPTLWKGYGDIVVYAKWSLESPQILVKNDDVEILVKNDDVEIQYSVIRTYDGKAHYLSHQVQNSNALYITYSHSWKVGTQTKTDAFYYYKNVTEETITLSVTAQLFYGATLYQTKTTTKQINLKVNQFEFFFDKVEKVFDGNANIASADGNYILVDIDLGEVVETLRLTGRYTSRFVGTNIELENTKLEKHSSFEPTNFKLTVAPGTITPKALVNVDLGEPEQNTKSYDTTPFVFTKERATSISLVSGHVLDITVKTIDFKVGTYTAEQNQILVLSWQVYDGSEDVTNCYTLESIIGGAQIVKQNSLNTAEITFSNTNAVYNGKQQFLYANTDLFAGGKIPSDVSLVYTWQKQGSATTYTYTEHGGPIEVGEYLIFLTVVADPDNYNINGVNPLEARLTILVRTVTLNLLTNTFEGVNQPIDVDTKLGTHQVDRLELAQGHYMQGYVTTNSSLPNTYTQNAGNLVSNLAIYDAQGNDVSHNYQIKIDGSIILINYYFIEYRPGLGNGAIQKQQVNYGQEVFLLANSFVRDGYTYSHWNTQIDGSGTSFAEREVVSNLAGHNQTFVLYPAWNASTNTKYYVEYYLENLDGTFDEQANFEEFYISTTEYKIELVPHIISDNLVSSYDFVVYDKETLVTITVFNKQYEGFTNAVVEDLSVLSGFVTPASQGSLRLKLYFKRNSYTLTLFKNNFESPAFISTPYLFEQLIDEPTQPTRSGYNFVGWYINYPGPTSYMVTWPFEMPAKNVDLWAIYTANPNTAYVLEYYEQNANGSYPSQPTRVENFAGTTDTYAFIEIEQTDGVITSAVLRVYDTEDKQNKVGTDYVFNISPTGMHMIMHPSQILSGKITASPTLALKVYYERNMYELTRVLHNGQANITTTHRYGEQVSQPTAPSYIGYVFDGWYLNFNETTGVYTNPLSWPLTISNNRTIHAKWKADANTQYTVYLYLENLDGTFNQTPDSTKTLTNTTNYYAEFNPVGNVIEVYTDASKQTHVATESGFTYLGFNLDVESSTISTTIKPDGSGEIVLYLLRNFYTVEFVYNNGQPNSTSEPVKYEQTINKPSDPTRTGYVFAGWHLDEALTKAVTWPYAVTANVVMFAKWNSATNTPYKIETYKQDAQGEYPETPEVENFVGTTGHYVAIEQDTVGEVLIWNLKVYTNSTKATLVGVVKSIEIEGYTFNQNGEVIEKAIAADGSMVIKLYYTLNSYIFTIEPNNGQEQQTQSVKFGQKPIMPQNPTRTGYVFDGWYLDLTFETPFRIELFAMPAYDVSIYAKWAPAKDTPYAIEYYLEELDETYPTHPNHTQHLVGTTNQYLEIEDWLLNVYQTAAKGAVINTQALQIFVGFSYSIEFESVHSASIAPDGTTALKVYLSRNHYALTLVYNNGQINKIITGVLFEQVVTEPVPTRQGYDFEGWYYDEDLTVKAPWTRENGNVSYVMEASDVTMYARWTARNDTPYSVEHYVENANDSNFTLHETKQYTGVTQTEVLAQTQTYAGFVFDQSNPNNITKGIVAADGTLVLKLYYTRQTYSLVFDGNGNTSGQMAPMQFKYGQTLALNQNSFARSGYNFIGWTDVAIGLVVKHTDKADFTFNKTSEITLYALWSIKPLDQATLTSSKPNPTINYGNTLVLTASAMHGADATTSYEWYYNGSRISHSGSTLEITEINQSGTYFVNIVIQGAIGQGAQSNTTSMLTSEIQVQVLARPIEIVFGQTNFVFNASHQSPTYNLRYVDNEDIEQPTRIIGFPAATAQLFAQSNLQTQTVNAGEYELQITLAQDDNFELIGAQNTTYTIEALEWNITSLINVGEFSKQYNYPPLEDPELSKALINPQTSEQITVYFEREAGEQIGVYDLILLPNQNTNYLITLDAGNKGFSILKSSQGTAQIGFKDLSLLTKVYDGQKINTNTQGFAIENLTASFGATIVDATFEIRNNNKNVGTYEIVLLSATTLEFANAELDAQYFFVITQRELQYVETDITKTYDGTKLFGHINFSNMVAEDQGFVDVIGMFASADVGTSIGVVASLDGSAKSNYKLGTTFANLVGTIVQRQVKVYAPTNIKIEYGSELPELTYQIFAQNLETGEFDQQFDASQATGSLKLTPAVAKLVVGTYLIEIDTITVSNNYTIVEYIGATLEVTPKSVSAIADWNKIYDGNTQFDKPIELVGILAQDDVEAVAQYATEQVGQNITITIELVGQDAPNYTLQNTSASGSITYHYVTAILDYQFEALATSEHSAVAETSLNLIYNKAIKESGYASLPVPTAVGYTFIGWYDQIENGNLFTKDTVISESNWPKDQAEKTLYARWDVGQVKLTVGVVTYSSKTYIIEDMSAALTGGTFTIDGVDYAEGGNMKVATFQTKVVVEAIAAQNYDFVGWFASPAADATPISKDSVFSPSGSILTVTMNNNITVYAKFKLKTATITLMANSNSTPVSFVGEFTNWNITLGNGIASVSQQFDMLTTISLPTPEQVSRTGYQLLGWYPTQNPPAGSPLLSGEYTLIANTVLYAVWQSNTYTATFVASTGDEDPELLNADKGSFENPTNPLEAGVLTQQVEFEKPIGQIQTPTRIGYTFDGWYDNPEYSGQPYTQDSTYNFAQNHSFYAKWKQNTYTVTITVANSKGGNITVEQTNGVLNVEKQNIGANQIITVSLLTGSTLKLVATSTQGHQISFVSDYQNGVDLVQTVVEAESSTQVELSRFVQNISVQFAFLAQLHKVEIEVENTLFGSISATVQNMIATQIRTVEQDDTQRVEDNTTGSTQKLTVWAFTGETIKVQITPNAGYQTIGLLKTSGNGELSALVDRAVTYSNFSQNSALTVLFEEQTHSIVVKVGKDMTFGQTGTKFGSFGISVQDDQGNITTIESNSQNNNVDSIVLIKTNQKLILHINANNGFVVSQTAEHYLFETQFAQDTSSFDLSDIANGTLVFENFVSSGQIVLPFERNVYSMQIQVALFDENTFTIVENPTQYANVQILTEFDKDDKFYFEQQIDLDIETQHGYEFVGWFGLLQESDMLSNLANYQGHVITQNQTIYAVVQLATFAITYEAEENGFIDADQLTNFVKFGKDGPVVNAVAFQGYEFYKWQILNPETQEWEDDLFNTQATRQEIAVSNNMTIRAVFAASAIEVTILSQYIIDRDENGDYVFAPMHEGVGTLQIVDLGLSGITFVAQVRTGDVLNLLANANQGYSIRAWTLSTGTNAIIEYNDGLKDISIKGFKENFTITALFEANENIFEIAVVKMFDNNFNFNNSQFVEGGAIDIDPRLYLNTQPYRSRVMAVVRTEHQFDISYFVYHGYNIILDPNDPTRAMIGIRYEDEQDVVFVESVSITDLMGVYAREVSFTMQGFRKGGTIVLFVEEQLYDVTFHKTETEQAVFKLKINSGFTVVDSDYRLPSRYGYLFDGWYSQPNGAGVKYIDNQGVVLREWSIEHPDLYANWLRAYVTINIEYVPGKNIADGPLGWNVRQGELKRASESKFEYYVGINTYFEAPDGIDGYRFSHWLKGNEIVSTQRHYYFSISEDEALAEYTLKIVYSVRVSVQATQGGTAKFDTGETSKYLLEGQKAYIDATPNDGYEFLGWRYQNGQDIISTQTILEVSYSSTASIYTAVFAGKKVEINIQNGDNGTVDGWLINGQQPVAENGKYYARYGDVLTFTTTPQIGYVLTGWLVNGAPQGNFDNYQVTLTDVNKASISFKPVFSLIVINYEILFGSSGEVKVNNQKINSGKVFTTNYYGYVTFLFNPTIRHQFKRVLLNGTPVSEDHITQVSENVYSINLPGQLLSLISVNKFELEFDKIFWLDVREAFSGIGTEQNPYLITSAQQFAQMAYLINNGIAVDSVEKVEYASAYYLLSVSVDFEERFWVPIGTQENPFDGVITLEYSRRNIVLDKHYPVTNLDGLFGYITDRAKFIQDKPDISTAIIVFSSVGGTFVIVAGVFVFATYRKRKRLKMQSRIFPTDRPTKR